MQISLRPLELDDHRQLFHIWNDKDLIQYTYHPHTPSEAYALQRISSILEWNGRNGVDYSPKIIEYRGATAGLVGTQCTSAEKKAYEIWYIVAREYWNQGIATAAVRQYTEYLCGLFYIERLYAEAVTDNAASIRVLEKCGFVKEQVIPGRFSRDGVVKDLCIYTLPKELRGY